MRKQKTKAGAPAVKTGRIVIWDGAKGFGWLECGEERLFFHEREFGGRQFGVGDEIRYRAGMDIKGRPCARSPEAATAGISVFSWLLLAALVVLPVLGLSKLPVPWWWPAAQVLALSAATWRLYAYDKRQAVLGGWRVPETSLHLAELAGGWPGAFLAQRRMRHKCAKGRYQVFFWCIILLHQIAGLDAHLGHHLSKEVWRMMGQGSVFGS